MKQFSHIHKCLAVLGTVFILLSCAQKDNLTANSHNQFFVQDLNPEYLDVLWVIDDRSQMTKIQSSLVSEATNFFLRLDGMTTSYRMGITTADTLKNNGALKPSGTILQKSLGTSAERAKAFGNMISQVINLKTGADNTGFAAASLSLSGPFVPRDRVPLVLVFISDSDDWSAEMEPGVDVVDSFAARLKALKGGNADLVRVYSINYVAVVPPEDPTPKRCATVSNADIDKTGVTRSDGSAWFQDRYFRLATLLGGETSDLCSSFSSKINLNGLKLKTLPRRFLLEKPASKSTLKVDLLRDGNTLSEIPWTYDESTHEIVFESTPPAGCTIQVTYLTGN